MRSNLARYGLAAAAMLGATACDDFGVGQERAAPAPSAPTATADPALRSHAGETFSAFVGTAGARYSPDALGLTAGDRARVWRAMATGGTGQILRGGGAEALVFKGCADTGCVEGAAVVAIDLTTGEAFVGVHDVGGADVLNPNDRVEGLLRYNSPTRSWDDAEMAPATPNDATASRP